MAPRTLLLYLAAAAVAALGVWNALQGAGPLTSLAFGVVVGGLLVVASRRGNAP